MNVGKKNPTMEASKRKKLAMKDEELCRNR